MTYFDDLARYSYSEAREEGWRELLCVGWLDASRDYKTGPTTDRFHVALLKLCAEGRVAISRGFHQCNLPPCDQRAAWPPVSITVSGRQILLGAAEIRVPADRGVGFAAPDLIYHYVVEHRYQPPVQFIEAVQLYVDHDGGV